MVSLPAQQILVFIIKFRDDVARLDACLLSLERRFPRRAPMPLGFAKPMDSPPY
jgi:hypothetical protein